MQAREACERQKGSYSITLRSPRQARFSKENNKKNKGGQSTDETAIYRGVSICSLFLNDIPSNQFLYSSLVDSCLWLVISTLARGWQKIC
jgi:hypothetical protein